MLSRQTAAARASDLGKTRHMTFIATMASLTVSGSLLVGGAAPLKVAVTAPGHTPKVSTHWNYFGKLDVGCAENAHSEHRDHVTVERCLAEVEIDVAQANEAADAPPHAKPSVALG